MKRLRVLSFILINVGLFVNVIYFVDDPHCTQLKHTKHQQTSNLGTNSASKAQVTSPHVALYDELPSCWSHIVVSDQFMGWKNILSPTKINLEIASYTLSTLPDPHHSGQVAISYFCNVLIRKTSFFSGLNPGYSHIYMHTECSQRR